MVVVVVMVVVAVVVVVRRPPEVVVVVVVVVGVVGVVVVVVAHVGGVGLGVAITRVTRVIIVVEAAIVQQLRLPAVMARGRTGRRPGAARAASREAPWAAPMPP